MKQKQNGLTLGFIYLFDLFCYIKHLHETKTTGLNDMQIHSLTAGGAYEPAMI